MENFKDNTLIYTGDTPITDYKTYGVGNYKIQLIVTNANGFVSEPYSKLFTVTQDTTPPSIIADPTTFNAINTQINVKLKFIDSESGFKSYKYLINDSNKPVLEDKNVTWSEDITKSEDTIVLNKFFTKQYIHIIAKDNIGNESEERILGEYNIKAQYNIELQSIDSKDKTGLEGATFKVSCTMEDGTNVDLGNYNATTNSNGKIAINCIALNGINKFTIETVSTPKGYVAPSYKIAVFDTSEHYLVFDNTNSSSDITGIIANDKISATIKIPMEKMKFNLNILNVDKDNQNIKINNSQFSLDYNGNTVASGKAIDGKLNLSTQISGVNKFDEYILNQVGTVNGYTSMTSTVLKIYFDDNGNLLNIVQKFAGSNENVIIDQNNIGDIKILSQKNIQATNFSVVANVTDRADSSKKIDGLNYKLLVEGENNFSYSTDEVTSDSNGNIKFDNLYGTGTLKLTLINTASNDKYSLESTARYLTINIDNTGKITISKASMEGVFDKIDSDTNTIFVKLNNKKKSVSNSIKIKVTDSKTKMTGIQGVSFDIYGLIDNKLIGSGTTNSDGIMTIDNLTIDGTGDVVYKIVPTNVASMGFSADYILINIQYDSSKKIEDATQITNYDYVNVYKNVENTDVLYTYVANIEIAEDIPEIQGTNQLIIKKVDSNTNSSLQGAKYQIKAITSQIQTTADVTDNNGQIITNIPNSNSMTLEIQEVEAPVGYKIDNTIKKLEITRSSDGKCTISNQVNVQNGAASVNSNGNIVLIEKNVASTNAVVKFNIKKTDNTGKISLGGVEFKISEPKTGYSQTGITDRNGCVTIPVAIINDAGSYDFTIEEVKTVSSYTIPNNKLVIQAKFSKVGNIIKYDGETDISGTDLLLTEKKVDQISENNEVDITLPIKNELSTSNVNGIHYSIDIKKVNSKLQSLLGSKYNVEIRPYSSQSITCNDCEVTDNIEIPNQILTKETTTILLQQTKEEIGYNLDNTLKVVSLYNDGSELKYLANTTSSDLKINIEDTIQNGIQIKVIHITIVTPEPTEEANPTGGDNQSTDPTSPTDPTNPEPDVDKNATVSINLFNKSIGSWDRTYREYYNSRIWGWDSYNRVYQLSDSQKLLCFFEDASKFGFNFTSGTILNAKTQLINNGKISDEIYEQSMCNARDKADNVNGSDVIKLYKDYANKQAIVTITEIVPAYNYKKIDKSIKLKVNFDANCKIISGEILEGNDLQDFAIGGISANGQIDNIKIPTKNYSGNWSYDLADIKDYNSIGTNVLYCGILNESINNVPHTEIKLKDSDTDDTLQGGQFNIIISEEQLDKSWNNISNCNATTDGKGVLSVNPNKTFANRKLRYYITQIKAPTVGTKIYKDPTNGTIKFDVSFDDDGNINEIKELETPSNMKLNTENKASNNILVNVYDEINNNFTINVTNLDNKGNHLQGIKMNCVSTLIKDVNTQTGDIIFEYGSGLSNNEGKSKLKVCLPTALNNNYFGKTVEYNMSETFVPDNYRALDNLKIRALYDAKGNVQQVSLVSGSGDKNIVIDGFNEKTIDVTITNEQITQKPVFQITTQDSEHNDTKLSGAQYKITSFDSKEYESNTLNIKDEITSDISDNSGINKINMDNSHALRSMVYQIEEISTPNAYVTPENILIYVEYDKDGKIAKNPIITKNSQINGKNVLKVIGTPIGSNILQLEIINELKPKFSIWISKYDTSVGSRLIRTATFKATSQVKQADGSLADIDEQISSATIRGNNDSIIGFKNSHNSQTVLYKIYDADKSEDILRGTLEITFDVDGNVINASIDGDYLKSNKLITKSNYVNVYVEVKSFKTKIQLNPDNNAYPLDGAEFQITNNLNEKSQQGIVTNATGFVIQTAGEIYKNKTVKYTVHQVKELTDFELVGDFSFDITFDNYGNISSCTPTSEDGKFSITSTKTEQNGTNLAISINQKASNRQSLDLKVYDEKDSSKITNAKYQVISSKSTNLKYDAYSNNVLDLGPDKGFANSTISYNLIQKESDEKYVSNPNTVQVAVDYNAEGLIDDARITKTDGYISVDNSSIGTRVLKLKTTNKKKMVAKIQNSNQYDNNEKLANNLYTISSLNLATTYDSSVVTDINGEATAYIGPYYNNQTVEYKISQNNYPDEFNKINDSTFKLTYDSDGKIISSDIPENEQSYLKIDIPDDSTIDGYNFKIDIANEPLVTLGIQTVDSVTNKNILGGKYKIVNNKTNKELTTLQDKIAHTGMTKSLVSTTTEYSIVELEAPLGYQYINRKNVIGTLKVTFDADGHIITSDTSVTSGYNYIKLAEKTDKSSLYDIDLQIKYDETKAFKVIIENQDSVDNTKKIVSTFNAQLSDGTTATTTTAQESGYGNLQFGTVNRDTVQQLVITQSDIKGNYSAVNTIGMRIKFDGSSKISDITVNTGTNFATLGGGFTIDSSSEYTIKITVKNNPITKLSIKDVNDGNQDKILNGEFVLTGMGIDSPIKMKMGDTYKEEAQIVSVPKGKEVIYKVEQVSVDKSFRLIKPIFLTVNYDSDGKITSASIDSGDNMADSSAVKLVSFDEYNINLQVMNKQAFSIYAIAEDAYNSTKLPGVKVNIEETTYSNQSATITTDEYGQASTELGTNKPGDTLNYDVKLINNPSGYVQQDEVSAIEANLRITFGSDGSVIGAYSSNPLLEASIENNLAVNLKVKYVPVANMEITRIDKANNNVLSGKIIDITSSQMSEMKKGTTDENGKFQCDVGAIITDKTIRYNISEENQDKENYLDLSNLYVDVVYDNLGNIANIIPSDNDIIQTSGIGTRKISIIIKSIKSFKISLTNVDFLQQSIKIGGTYQILSSKGEKSDEITLSSNSVNVNMGSMYPGESVTYTIHQVGKSQYGYEIIPDINFIVTYDNSGNISNIIKADENKDNRILYCKWRSIASTVQSHADIQFGSKAQLLVKLKLIDKLYNQGVQGISFKIKDENSGIENKVETVSDENGILEVPIDSVYSSKSVTYIITQLATNGGYNIVKPFELVVQYDKTGTISTAGTFVKDLSIARITDNYSKDLYANKNLKGVQVEIYMNSNIGIGIEHSDNVTGSKIQGASFVVNEREISTNKVKSWDCATDSNGQIMNFDRAINGDVSAIEYTINQIKTPSGYRLTDEIQLVLYFNSDGKVIASKPEKMPENVEVSVATDKLLTMSDSNYKVHLKLLIKTDNRITFKINNKDSNVEKIGIKGSKFLVSVNKSGTTVLSDKELITDSNGMVSLDGIEGPGDLTISFKQVEVGRGYLANSNNQGYIKINKASDAYSITYIDSSDGLVYNIDNKIGVINVTTKNESDFKLNIYDVDIDSKNLVKGSQISLKAQVGEKDESISDIIEKTDNIVTQDNFKNESGTLTISLGNSYKLANKKVVYVITETTAPESYEKYDSVTFSIEFDNYGKIAKINKNSFRAIEQKIQNDYEASIWIGHGNISSDYKIKIINKSSNGEIGINGAKFNLGLSNDDGVKEEHNDIVTAQEKLNGEVLSDGVAVINGISCEGNVTLKLTQTGSVEGYKSLGLDNVVELGFNCTYDKSQNPAIAILKNPTSNNNNVILEVNDVNKEVNIIVKSNPVFNLKITNKDENNNSIIGDSYNISAMILGDLSSKIDYGAIKANDLGELVKELSRDYRNQSVLLTIDQEQLNGYNLINSIVVQLDIDENGKIHNSSLLSGNDNAVLKCEDYNINIEITNKANENYPKMKLKIVKQDSGIASMKLKNAVFQIKVIPDKSAAIYKVEKSDEKGEINLSNIVASGNVNIKVLEIMAPEGYIVDETQYNFVVNKDDNKSELTKVSSNIDSSLWSVNSESNLVQIQIPNKSDEASIGVKKVDESNGMGISGVEFTLVDTKQNITETEQTNNEEIAKFKIAKMAGVVGTYTITETKVPQGYVKENSPTTVNVEFDNDGNIKQASQNISSNIIDKQTNNYVQIKMSNKQSDIGVKDYNLNIVNIDAEDADIKINGGEFKVNIKQEQGSDQIETVAKIEDKNSGILINNINGAGKIDITINENQVSEGYVADTTAKTVSLERSITDGAIKILKYTNAYPVYDTENNKLTIYVANKKKQGKYALVINKVDKEGKNIEANSEVDVKLGNSEAKRYTTNEKGKIIISNLDLPEEDKFDIVLKEQVVPEGYVLDTNECIISVETSNLYGSRSIADVKTYSDSLIVENTSPEEIVLNMSSSKSDGDLYITSDKYNIINNYAEHISPGTTVEKCIENIKSNGKLVIYNAEGSTLSKDATVGTNMIIKAEKDGNTITKVLVVLGDINGDGKISTADIAKLNKAYVGKIQLNDVQKKAADVNGDGKISTADIAKLNKAYVGKIVL